MQTAKEQSADKKKTKANAKSKRRPQGMAENIENGWGKWVGICTH